MFRSIVFSLALATSAVAYNWNGRGGHPYVPAAPPKEEKPKTADAPKVNVPREHEIATKTLKAHT
jgi:hypothetical protein